MEGALGAPSESGVKMNRVQLVKKTFPKFVDTAIELAEPAHKNKYLLWIAQQLANKHGREDISATITAFHTNAKRLKHKDIYSYKDLKQLENELKDLAESHRQQEIASKGTGARRIYEDEHCTVTRVDSKSAMLYYGKGSKWCISMEKQSYWEEYSWEGHIFYVLVEKKQNRKYCIQKTGLLRLNIWTAADTAVEVDSWVLNNQHLEAATLSCLQDTKPGMWRSIKDLSAKQDEILKWLEYQHPDTVKFVRAKAPLLAIDPKKPVVEVIGALTNLTQSEVKALYEQEPEFIVKVADYLTTNKEHFKKLRGNLGKVLPERCEEFMLPVQIFEERSKTDPTAVVPLLLDPDPRVWRRFLTKAEPQYLLKVLRRTKLERKRNEIARELSRRIASYPILFKFLADLEDKKDVAGVPKIPKGLWNGMENRTT